MSYQNRFGMSPLNLFGRQGGVFPRCHLFPQKGRKKANLRNGIKVALALDDCRMDSANRRERRGQSL